MHLVRFVLTSIVFRTFQMNIPLNHLNIYSYDNNFPSTGSTYSTGLDTQTCTASTLTSSGRDDALRVVNMYRYFSGLDPVTATSSSGETNASACALMCHEKGKLQHDRKTSLH